MFRARATILACAVLVAGCARDDESEVPPSILLVVVDTLRADHLGLYGYERDTSPALDAWAAEGLVFEQALAGSSWTLPSMASLLSGLEPGAHGAGVARDEAGEIVRGEAGNRAYRILPSSVRTLAERLREHGYTTAAFVTNEFVGERFGLAQGFELFEHHGNARAAGVVEAARDWLARRQDQPRPAPWFAYVHLIDPHLPYHAGEPAAGRFTGALSATGLSLPVDDLPRLRREAPTLTADERGFIAAAYDEEIAYVDLHLERLFDDLRARFDPAPLTLLTSDHGEELFERGGFEHGHSMHQEVLRVPLIVHRPGFIQPGRDARLVGSIDVAATILSTAGISNHDLAGRPLEAAGDRAALLCEGTLYGEPRPTLVRWPHKLIGSAAPRAFDLRMDPRELTPLDDARLIQSLQRELDEREASARGSSGNRAYDPVHEVSLERLRELGYVDSAD